MAEFIRLVQEAVEASCFNDQQSRLRTLLFGFLDRGGKTVDEDGNKAIEMSYLDGESYFRFFVQGSREGDLWVEFNGSSLIRLLKFPELGSPIIFERETHQLRAMVISGEEEVVSRKATLDDIKNFQELAEFVKSQSQKNMGGVNKVIDERFADSKN